MNFPELFYQGWSGIVRTVIVGAMAYMMLILFLRISGKRTLAKLNAFDLVVTVALGSTLSAVLLQESIALAEGAIAFALLIVMQFLVTWISVRCDRAARAVRSEPTLLVRNGTTCPDAMRRQRVTRDEILSVIRLHGYRDLGEVEAVVLESDGTLSVIPKS